MAETWESISEIVAGLIYTKRLPVKVRPDIFYPPYDDVIKLMQSDKGTAEDIVSNTSVYIFESITQAAKSCNDVKLDWVSMLERAYMENVLANTFEYTAKKLRNGENTIDFSKITKDISQLNRTELKVQKLSNITETFERFIPSGWAAFDKHMGGLPATGLFTLAAKPGVGKTTTMLKFVESFVRQYPDKNVFIATLEMTAPELKDRIGQMFKLTKQQKERIYVYDEIADIHQISNMASQVENVGLVGIDFADKCIRGEITEGTMAEVYDVSSTLAKNLKIPVILLSQFAKSYNTGLPLPIHLRYTAMAEALSWMIGMIYNPYKNHFDKDPEELPKVPGRAYLIMWKSRGGFIQHIHDSPGAIALRWDNEKGWHNTQEYGWIALNE